MKAFLSIYYGRPYPIRNGDLITVNDRLGLAAAVSLVIAAFAAIGIAGDYVARAARDSPVIMAVIVALVLVAVAFPLAAAAKDNGPTLASVIVLVALLIGAVGFGAYSVSQREQPGITLSAAVKDTARYTLTVAASASGLPSNETMLVQLLALTTFDPSAPPEQLCEADQLRRFIPPTAGVLLASQVSGPDVKGAASRTLSIDIPSANFGAACAWVALPEKNANDPRDDRKAVAYLVLSK